MSRRATVLVSLCLALASPAVAQVRDADAAFERGDYHAARAGYERALAQDSLDSHALYRLAVLDSWDGQLERSLARFVTLRRIERDDEDIMVAHARVLSWANRTAAAVALYDTVLRRTPARVDAIAGRARAVAWGGDLDRAEALWREGLTSHADDPELLAGLAQTLYWKGQPALAEGFAARARQLAPNDRSTRDLLDLIRAARRPDLTTWSDYAHDSDRNLYYVQQAWYSSDAGGGKRATLHGQWRHANLPGNGGGSGDSYGADAALLAPLGHRTVLRTGLGVRRLAPDSGTARLPLTAQLGVSVRPGPFAAIGLAYSRSPFDETAVLIAKGFTTDAVDFSAELSPQPTVSVSAGGGSTWFSDGNRRLGGVAAVMVGVGRGLQVGALGRGMGFRVAYNNHGYFAPDRFTVFEGRAVYAWRRARWSARVDGGLGTQKVGKSAPSQSAWHGGFDLARGWAANSELALVGSITNSAASRTGTATAAAFRYWTLGVRLRQGL